MERHDRDCGFDAQELHEPILVLGLDFAGHCRLRRRGSEREGGFFVVVVVVLVRVRVVSSAVADADSALALKGAGHEVWLVGSCGGGTDADVVFDAVIY